MKTTATKIRISPVQLFMMVIAVTAAFGHFVYVHIAIVYAGRDAWISLLVGAVCGMGILYLQMKYSTQKPNMSLVTHTKHVFGKWLGSAITVLYILFFLFVVAATLKTVTDFMGIVYPTTPPGVFVFAVLGVATWASHKGLEVIARSIQLALPLLMVLGLSASLLSAKDKNFWLILPVLNHGWAPVWKGAFVFASMFAELIVFAMFTSDVNEPKKLPRMGIVVTGILAIMFIAPVTGPIMLFGEHLAQTLAFPTYTEIQYIHIANIVERFDIVGVLLWTIGSFFRISVFLFAACKSVAQLFNAKENDYTIPTALLAGGLALSVMKSSREEVYQFLGYPYLVVVLAIGVGIPLITECVAMIHGRFVKPPATQKGGS